MQIKDTFLSLGYQGRTPREIDVIDAIRRAMRSPRIPVFRWAIVFALIFASGAFGFALPSLGSSLPLLILPSGFAVGAMYRWGRRMWPAVFAASIATDLWVHQPLF